MKSSILIKQTLGTLVFFAIIFISAGKISYWQGWTYVIIGLLMFVLSLTLLRPDPELEAERSKPGQGAKQWDKLILGLTLLTTVAMYILAGLDSGRFQWSPDFHPGFYIAGGLFTATGQLLFLIVQKQNRFFSSTVRIQTERGHTVCESGLYKFVRHPAYLGSIIQVLGFPMLLGSLWSTIPVCLSIGLLISRTYMEDKTLQAELNGYAGYSVKTRFRLIPYIW